MEFVESTVDPVQVLVSGIQSIHIDPTEPPKLVHEPSSEVQEKKEEVITFRGFNPKGTYYIGKSNINKVQSTFKAGGVLLYRVNPSTRKFQVLVGLEYRELTETGVPLSVHPIGGRRDPGEEPLLTSAREFYEETGELFPLQKIMDTINPIHRKNYSLPPIHRPKSFYFTGGKYCMYVARCPTDMETVDERYNQLKSSDISVYAELAGVTWVDWEFFENFFQLFAPNQRPGRDALYVVAEEDRAQFVKKVMVDAKEKAVDNEVIFSSFILELFGNALVYSEICSRRDNML